MTESLKEELTLGVGKAYLASEPSCINTILGSCVAVILYDAMNKRAAICHAQLPSRIKNGIEDYHDLTEQNKTKYVSYCIESMLNQLSKLGSKKSNLKTMLIGGSSIFPITEKINDIGSENIHMARQILKKHNLRISFEDTGGCGGRKITYISDTNELQVKSFNISIEVKKRPTGAATNKK